MKFSQLFRRLITTEPRTLTLTSHDCCCASEPKILNNKPQKLFKSNSEIFHSFLEPFSVQFYLTNIRTTHSLFNRSIRKGNLDSPDFGILRT